MRRNQAGAGQVGALLILLLLLCGGGAWNYYRNVQAEQAQPRPYRGLDERELAALEEALEAEVEAYARRYEAATGRRVPVSDEGLLGEKVEQFERVQAQSAQVREIGQRLSQSESSLRRVRAEQQKREEERDRTRLFLRRLLTIRV